MVYYVLPVVWLVALVGWVLNVVALVSMVVHDHPLSTMFVARIAGVLVPVLGAVLGYF